jgi:hypothetical protein
MPEQLHRRLPVAYVAKVWAACNRQYLLKAQACELWGLCQAQLYRGDRLDRPPAELLQMVGETGWQLSNDERSRLYMHP